MVSEKEKHFSQKRIDAKVSQYTTAVNVVKPPNRLELRTGIEVMPLVLGRVLYSSLRKEKHIKKVKEELRYQNLSDEGGWKKDMLRRLKEDENDQKSFAVRCPTVSFDDIYL